MKYLPILLFSSLLAACTMGTSETNTRQTPLREAPQDWEQTVCVDADTSIKNDVSEVGIPWSLSTDELKHILSLATEESNRNIYVLNDITTCEMTFNKVEFGNSICEVTLNAGAYGNAICSNGSKYVFGCYEDACNQYFPFPFVSQE